jgi:hypothetical protein
MTAAMYLVATNCYSDMAFVQTLHHSVEITPGSSTMYSADLRPQAQNVIVVKELLKSNVITKKVTNIL